MVLNCITEIFNSNKSLFIIGLVALIVIFAIVYYKKKDFFNNLFISNSNSNSNSNSTEKFEEKKIVKFFGASYCPYSNDTSISYKVMKDFEDKYKDSVEVQYYWTDTEKDSTIAMEYQIQYVPAIFNNNKEQIDLTLPEGIDKTTKTNDELRELLLNNLYSKLT